jgi:DNA-directed RNA polymerase II subunit RPB9
MATPVSQTSMDDAKPKEHEDVTFRFCSECSNMLYPKEDEEARRLQYVCRTCQYTENATSTCVFRHTLHSQAGETAGVTQDVSSDPTVGASSVVSAEAETPAICLLCGCAVFCAVCAEPMVPSSFPEYDAANFGPRKASSGGAASGSTSSGSVFSYVFDDEDPFDEYDEERMDVTTTDECFPSELRADTLGQDSHTIIAA